MAYSRSQLFELSKKVGRSWRNLQYWAAQGCDLNDPQSLQRFVEEKNRKRTNVQKAKERRGNAANASPVARQKSLVETNSSPRENQRNNGKTAGTRGRRGAAGTLERLEATELQAYRRLQAALEHGDQFQISAAEDFWLKCSETLRRLDLAVQAARRSEEEQIPKKLGQDVALYISDWLRIAFVQFLSSEARPLMGIRDVGQWKFYAFERFKGILNLTVQSSLKTNSPIPPWAAEKVRESWNVNI